MEPGRERVIYGSLADARRDGAARRQAAEVVAVARRGQVRRRVVGAAGQRPRHTREDLARSHVAVRDEAPAAFSRCADLDGRETVTPEFD